MKLEEAKNKYKVVKSGNKYQVCKVIEEHTTEEEAMESMLRIMDRE